MKTFIVFLMLLITCESYGSEFIVQQNNVIEWSVFTNKSYKNPFMDIDVWAIIKDEKGKMIRLPAFWKGNGIWSFRFSSGNTEKYSFTTECSDKSNKELNGQKGEIRVVPYNGNNPLYANGKLSISADRHYIEHANGKPFFWLADSWWFGMSKRISYNNFCFLVNDRKEKGFSVIQFAIGFACDINPFDDRDRNEAGFIWQKDMSSINPEYFEYTDRRIQYLVESGIMPNLVGAWAYYISFLGTERMTKHWQYLIARYGAYPLCWTLCGEAGLGQLEIQRREWSVIADFIKKTDPFQHILTVHSGPNSASHLPINRMDLIDIFLTQPGHGDFETLPRALAHLQKAQQMYPDKPCMAGEVCFEGMAGACKEKIQRYLFWSHLLSGACGHSYGTDATWQFNSREDKFGKSKSGRIWGNEPWEEGYQWPGSKQLGIGKKFLETLEWHKIRPHPGWASESANSTDFMKPFIAGIPQKLRLVYFPKGSSLIIKELEKDIQYNAFWFDPIKGDKYDVGIIKADPAGEWKTVPAPINQDWLLVMLVQ